MIRHNEITDRELRKRIRQNEIFFGGNIKVKIYGRLNCKSGKRMRKENRIFCSDTEAINNGFRPCGHCMKSDYEKWKNQQIILSIFLLLLQGLSLPSAWVINHNNPQLKI